MRFATLGRRASMVGDPPHRIAYVIGELGKGGAEYQLYELLRHRDRRLAGRAQAAAAREDRGDPQRHRPRTAAAALARPAWRPLGGGPPARAPAGRGGRAPRRTEGLPDLPPGGGDDRGRVPRRRLPGGRGGRGAGGARGPRPAPRARRARRVRRAPARRASAARGGRRPRAHLALRGLPERDPRGDGDRRDRGRDRRRGLPGAGDERGDGPSRAAPRARRRGCGGGACAARPRARAPPRDRRAPAGGGRLLGRRDGAPDDGRLPPPARRDARPGNRRCRVRPRAGSLAAARVGRIVGRALRLRCPRCGRSPLYARYFRMHERCVACGLRYEREQGFFVGAIYINYAVTVAVAVGVVLGLDWTVGLTLAQQLAIGVVLGVVIPLAFFRHARSLWLVVNYLVAMAEQRSERAR